MYPEIAIENYVLDYFVNPSQTLRRPFADPSHKLRASAQGFGSGQRLTLLFCHSPFFVILTLSEAKGKNLIPKLSF